MFADYHAHAAEFSHAPFWFWNDDLSEPEIARQLADFQAHGVHAVVIHSRAGLPRTLEWMSERLLSFMRFAIEEAARRSMWVILYDEGMYPSGSSAGQVVAENPAFACRGLVRIDLDAAERGTVVQGVHIVEGGKPSLLPNQTLVAMVKDCHGHWLAIVDQPIQSHIRGLHFTDGEPPRRADHKEVPECLPAAADLLNPDAMACFRRCVYDRFHREFGAHFGTTIKGIFTDEPSLLGRGPAFDPRPGTNDILSHVNRILGYDFTPHLPALWDDAEPDARRYRTDYHHAVESRLEETYYQPLCSWCEEHGLWLCGHPGESDNIGQERYFHVPGQDVVLRRILPDTPSALEGVESVQAKNAASAMVHLGRRRNSNEFAGAYGHQHTFEEYRWLALWLLARGCNLLIPHAFYYSVRGPRVDERPRDVGPNSPWWDRYPQFAELTGKLSWLNTDSTPVCDIAILTRGAALPWAAASVCLRNQRDFLYLEDRHLWEDAVIKSDGVHIAGMHYRAVITEGAVSAKAAPALKALEAAGALVPWQLADGEATLLRALDHLTMRDVTLNPVTPSVRMRHVRKAGHDWVLLWNEEKTPISTEVRLATSVRHGKILEGDTLRESSWIDGQAVRLPGYGLAVIVL